MSNPFRKYDGLSYRELRWRLQCRQMPADVIEQTIESVRAYRRELSTLKAKSRARDKRWREVMQSLQHERKIVRAMLRYKTKTPTPERDEFLTAYADALTKLYEKMSVKRRLEYTLPEHSHWTDYVPERIKEAFRLAADGVPPRQRAKYKEPFKRTDPMELRDLRQGRMMRHIYKELETTIAALEAEPDNKRLADKEYKLRTAQRRTRELAADAHVPNHWSDMIPDLMGRDKDDDTEE